MRSSTWTRSEMGTPRHEMHPPAPSSSCLKKLTGSWWNQLPQSVLVRRHPLCLRSGWHRSTRGDNRCRSSPVDIEATASSVPVLVRPLHQRPGQTLPPQAACPGHPLSANRAAARSGLDHAATPAPRGSKLRPRVGGESGCGTSFKPGFSLLVHGAILSALAAATLFAGLSRRSSTSTQPWRASVTVNPSGCRSTPTRIPSAAIAPSATRMRVPRESPP